MFVFFFLIDLTCIWLFCSSQGTVFDDITHTGCVAVEQCFCLHNGKPYKSGESYSSRCHEWWFLFCYLRIMFTFTACFFKTSFKTLLTAPATKASGVVRTQTVLVSALYWVEPTSPPMMQKPLLSMETALMFCLKWGILTYCILFNTQKGNSLWPVHFYLVFQEINGVFSVYGHLVKCEKSDKSSCLSAVTLLLPNNVVKYNSLWFTCNNMES